MSGTSPTRRCVPSPGTYLAPKRFDRKHATVGPRQSHNTHSPTHDNGRHRHATPGLKMSSRRPTFVKACAYMRAPGTRPLRTAEQHREAVPRGGNTTGRGGLSTDAPRYCHRDAPPQRGTASQAAVTQQGVQVNRARTELVRLVNLAHVLVCISADSQNQAFGQRRAQQCAPVPLLLFVAL